MTRPPLLRGVTTSALLGAGGFGVVWEGVRDGAAVAIKVAHRGSAYARARARREAEALAAVGPPHVPALLEHGTLDDGRPYLILERLRGQTLAAWLRGLDAAPSLDTVGAVGGAILDSLAAIHAHGLTHRDLTPGNIFLRTDGTVAIVDFGLTRRAESAGLTGSGVAVGTPAYSAPEQLVGEDVDARADVYAFGAILYELTTLRPPFVGDAASVEHGHLRLRPARPGLVAPMPPSLEELVLACLAKEPARRPASVAELRGALAAACAQPVPPRAAGGAAAAPGGDAGEPMVLLWIETGGSSIAVAAAVEGRGGWMARQRGDRYVAAFGSARLDDPARAALAAAREILRSEGGRAALHLARLTVRPGARAPRLAGEALDRPERWLPAEPWGGAHVPEELGSLAADEPTLVGRDALLGAVSASAARAVEDRVPGAMLLVGPRGAGKSRLLAEAGAVLRRQHPTAQLIRVGGEHHRDAARELMTALGEAVPTEEESLRLALGDALRLHAARRPLLILVDDAHRAGDAFVDALEGACCAGAGVVSWALLAADPAFGEARPRWGLRIERLERLEIPPLDEDAAQALTAELLRPAEYPPAEVLARIAAWTGRSPLHLVEGVRALVRLGVVRQRPGAPGHTLATELIEGLPASPPMTWLALRSLADLAPPVARFARLCALLGDAPRREALEGLLDELERSGESSEAIDAGVGLAELARAGILVPHDGGFRFRVPVLREAILGQLGDDERLRLHRHALAHFSRARRDLAEIARHAGACGERAVAAAAHRDLADAAAAANQRLEADAHYTRVLELGDADQRLHALTERGALRTRLDRFPEAVADLRAAHELAAARGDRRREAVLLLEEATALDWMEAYDRSRERVAAARPIVEALGDPTLALRLALAEGRSAWRAGDPAVARRLLEGAVQAAAALGDTECHILALLMVAPPRVMEGAFAEARAALDEVIRHCLRSGDRKHLAAAYGNRCVLALATQSFDEGVADMQRVMEIAREDGHPTDERKACYNLAELSYWNGDDDAALPLVQRAWLLEERFEGRVMPHTPLLVARIHAGRGDAPALAAALVELEARAGDPGWGPADRVQLGVLRLVAGGAGDWDALLEESRALSPEERLEVLWYLARTVPARRRAAIAEARPLLDARPLWGRRFDHSFLQL